MIKMLINKPSFLKLNLNEFKKNSRVKNIINKLIVQKA